MSRFSTDLFHRGPSISRRFIYGTAAMLVPLLVLAVSSYLVFTATVRNFDRTVAAAVNILEAAREVERGVNESLLSVHDYLIMGRAEDIAAFRQANGAVEAGLRRLRAADGFGEAGLQTQTLTARWRDAEQMARRLVGHARASPATVDAAAMGRLHEAYDATAAAIDDVFAQIRQLGVRAQERAHRNRRRVILLVGGMLGIGILSVIAIGLLLANPMLRRLRKLERGAQRYGRGDFRQRVVSERDDEIGRLTRSFNEMADLLEAHHARLAQMASRDPLTDVYNKREFGRLLQEEVARAERYGHPLSFVLLDIDHFKPINDTHGHQAGDRVLRELAALIARQLRPADHLARYGGEEFAIIMPQVARAGALATAERVRGTVAAHRFSGGIRLTISLGVAQYGPRAGTGAELVEAADRALYAAKQGGRNQVRAAGPDEAEPLRG